MAHPLVWPGKYFFYAIGNTSAVTLTRDLPPDERANILLLGCGDPRHVLYTVYSEPESSTRKLDFTCVDIDPAILARNVLLLSLIADKASTSTMWNIFYHLYLDPESHSVLIEHCKKLIDASLDLPTWRASIYASYLRVSTEYTLVEMRRHWSLYIALPDLPSRRQKAIRQAYENVFKTRNNTTSSLTSARSAGLLLFKAQEPAAKQALNYWKTGTTFTHPKTIAQAKLLNPTFAYSLAGEGCAVHYGTDPLTPFHFAHAFGNSTRTLSAADMVSAAKTQFSEWCAAFSHVTSETETPRVRVRFLLAEATAACRALRAYAATDTLNVGIPVMQFRTTLLRLDKGEYVDERAPVSFNVIETSNLVDHIGLLNILVAVTPLMSFSPSSALYTESLLYKGEDATKEFTDLLHMDVGTMGLLLDLCPTDYISGFSTRSNAHELLLTTIADPAKGKDRKNKDPAAAAQGQFHQVTTWKRPSTSDSVLSLRSGHTQLPLVFDPRQLGTLLYDMYQSMFEQEDSRNFFNQNQGNFSRAVAHSNLIHYMRETFVLFLKLVRERLRILEQPWSEAMDRLFELESNDTTMPMNTVNRNDLYAHMHRQGIYSVTYYKDSRARSIGRFSGWDFVPPVVRVVLVIPREKINSFVSILEESGVGTPSMQCHIGGQWSLNTFSAVHVGYGRVVSMGSKSNPRVLFEEDPDGDKGSLPLVASFIASSMLLSEIEPPSQLRVVFGVRSTTGTVALHRGLGLSLEVYSASLMDEEKVYVLPEPTLSSSAPHDPSTPMLSLNTSLSTRIGVQDVAFAVLDEQCVLVNTLVTRVNITDPDVVRDFGAGAIPEIAQLSPSVMRLKVSGRVQDVVFPFPVVGSQNKLRLARKSKYMEVVVPPTGPFLKPDGLKLNPFPVIGNGKVLSAWNIHRVTLDRLPALDVTGPDVKKWFEPLVGSQLSTRERKLRKKNKDDALLFVKDTIHTIFVRSAGTQGGDALRVFALRDEKTNNCDTVIFVGDIRYDLASHSVVCDAYVLPLTHPLLFKIERDFGKLVTGGSMVTVTVYNGEMEAWKQLLPALVERCRTWAHADDCTYLAQQAVPLTQQMESDPLCACGRGQDVGGMMRVKSWRPYAPHVTRIALSPLFAVSYLEAVGRNPAAPKCSVCRGRGKPKMMTCSGCQKVRYCSVTCQKKDWVRHKPECKAK